MPALIKNLAATVTGSTVVLTWTNPLDTARNLVFRDTTEIESSSTGIVTFTDTNVPAGTHTYGVVPIGDTATLPVTVGTGPPPPTAKVIMGAFVNGNTGSTAQAFVTGFGGNPATSVCSAYWDGGASSTWADLATNAVSNIVNLASWPGPRMLSVGLVPQVNPNPWNDAINKTAAWTSCWTSIFNAAKANGLTDLRTEWEYNSGTQNWHTNPTVTQFTGNYQAVHALKQSIYPALRIWFNPNNGIAINDNYAGQHPYTSWFPGANGADVCAVDVYTGPNPSYPGGTAPDNGAPWSDFVSGTHVNLNDIVTLARGASLVYVGVGEWGAEGSGYDNPADIDGMMAWAHAAQAAGVSVILIVWGNGSWSMEQFPAMWAELKTQVTAGRTAGWIA